MLNKCLLHEWMNAGPVIGTMLQLTPMSLKPFPSPRFYNEMYLSSKKIEDIPKSQKEFLPSALFINNYQPPNLGVTQKFSKSKQGHLWAHTGIGRAGASVKVKGGNQRRLSLCKWAPPPPQIGLGAQDLALPGAPPRPSRRPLVATVLLRRRRTPQGASAL